MTSTPSGVRKRIASVVTQTNDEPLMYQQPTIRSNVTRASTTRVPLLPSQYWAVFALLLAATFVSTMLVLGNRKVYDGTYWKASPIIPGLYLGAYKDMLNIKKLREHNITHILSVAIGLEPVYPADFEHMTIRAYDEPHQDLISTFEQAHRFIDEGIRNGGGVLVHCMAGVSRSTTIVTSYVMYYRNWPLYDAFELVKLARKRARPIPEFWNQLELYHRVGLNHSHTDLPRILPRWPSKADMYRWTRPKNITELPLVVRLPYSEATATPIASITTTAGWYDWLWHKFLYVYNLYFRYQFV